MLKKPDNSTPLGQTDAPSSLGSMSFLSSNANARQELRLAFQEHPSAYLSAAQDQSALFNALSKFATGFVNDSDRSYHAGALISALKKSLIQIDQLPLPTGSNSRCHKIANELIETLEYIRVTGDNTDDNVAMHLCNLIVATRKAFSTSNAFEVAKYAINGADQTGSPLEFPIDTLLTLTHAKGVIFDVDNCLVWSEEYQKRGWYTVLEEVSGGKRKAADDLKQVLNNACEKSDWKHLMPNLAGTMLTHGIFPNNVSSYGELDAFFRDKRAIQLKRYCENGDIVLTPGTPEFLMALKERGIKIGIFTSSSKILADSMLTPLLAAEGIDYNEIIPENQRVYGPTIERPKPDPQGWHIAAKNLGLMPEEITLFDDGMRILAHAAAATPHFGATIGIYHNDSSTKTWRKVTANRMFDSNCSEGEIVRFNPETVFGFIKNFNCFVEKNSATEYVSLDFF